MFSVCYKPFGSTAAHPSLCRQTNDFQEAQTVAEALARVLGELDGVWVVKQDGSKFFEGAQVWCKRL